MKNPISLFAILILFAGCNKDNNTGNGNGNGMIPIKGSLSGTTKSKSDLTSSMTDAKKVLVFSKYYYSITDIVDGHFNVNGQMSTGVALIFLDGANHYIGTLSTRGLNMLPLGNLPDGENTVIDLSSVTLEGKSVIPSHDPFGYEIRISETELNSLRTLDDYYASLSKNIDADNDGAPDVLTNKELVLNTIFGVPSGTWGLNNKKPVLKQGVIKYTLEFAGGSALTFANGNIALSGPAGDPYTDISLWGYHMNPGAERGFLASFGRNNNGGDNMHPPFKKGTYTLTLNGSQNYTLEYSNIDVQNSLVIVAPTLNTNSEGKLVSVSLNYTLPNGDPVEPASILTNVMVQLVDPSQKMIYVNDRSRLNYKTGFSTVTCETPVDISKLMVINVGYDDLLGNTYLIVWNEASL
jgi:hypothetical protein